MKTNLPLTEIEHTRQSLLSAGQAMQAALQDVEAVTRRLEPCWGGAAPETFHARAQAWLEHGAYLRQALAELAQDLQTLAGHFARADG